MLVLYRSSLAWTPNEKPKRVTSQSTHSKTLWNVLFFVFFCDSRPFLYSFVVSLCEKIKNNKNSCTSSLNLQKKTRSLRLTHPNLCMKAVRKAVNKRERRTETLIYNRANQRQQQQSSKADFCAQIFPILCLSVYVDGVWKRCLNGVAVRCGGLNVQRTKKEGNKKRANETFLIISCTYLSLNDEKVSNDGFADSDDSSGNKCSVKATFTREAIMIGFTRVHPDSFIRDFSRYRSARRSDYMWDFLINFFNVW